VIVQTSSRCRKQVVMIYHTSSGAEAMGPIRKGGD
jgi:hypothetical protein